MDLSVTRTATPIVPPPAETRRASAVRLEDVIKVYRESDMETIALRGVDLDVPAGEFVAVMGRSGSGKSTLLNLVAAVDRPTAGRVLLDGIDIARAGDEVRQRLRRGTVGIVFQSQNLVPSLDLVENVCLAAALGGRPLTRAGARDLLGQVDVADRGGHRPDHLSGGEQQRAALACVLAARPRILLADEITGELDTANGALVLHLVREIHRSAGLTVLLVTHDPVVADRADRIVELRDGRIVGDRRSG